MSGYERAGRQQRLREAEGYLDLLMVFADRWPPSLQSRDRLAQRALDILCELEPSAPDVGYVYYLQGQCLRTMEKVPRGPSTTSCFGRQRSGKFSRVVSHGLVLQADQSSRFGD